MTFKTYDEVLTSLKENFYNYSGIEIKDQSDLDINYKVLASLIYSLYCNQNHIENQLSLTTATGEVLDDFAMLAGISRFEGEKARGYVTFYLLNGIESLNDDLCIPKGTRICANVNGEFLYYETDEDVYFEGANVDALATAVEPGEKYNLAPGQSFSLVVDIDYVESVKNRFSIKGGTERQDDNSLRQDILFECSLNSSQSHLKYYENIAKSFSNVDYVKAIYSQNPNEINVYVSLIDDSLDTINEISKQINSLKDIFLDVNVYSYENYPSEQE